MPSLVLGPQAIGTARRWVVGPIKGPDGANLTTTVTLTGSEPLACRIWQGEAGATLVTITPTWASTSAGTIALGITAAAIAGLSPGRYRIDLTATIGGDVLAVLPVDAVIDLADAPGALAVAGWLASAEDCRAALGTAFGRRPDLPALIGVASAALEDHCRRTFAQASLDEFHSGTGRPLIYLARPPIASPVTTVKIDGVALDNTLLDQWQLDATAGELLRGDGKSSSYPSTYPTSYLTGYPGYPGYPGFSALVWPLGYRNVEVLYTGGYLATPAPVRQACVALVKHLADATLHTGHFSMERIGDYEYTTDGGQGEKLPWICRALCAPYVLPRSGG